MDGDAHGVAETRRTRLSRPLVQYHRFSFPSRRDAEVAKYGKRNGLVARIGRPRRNRLTELALPISPELEILCDTFGEAALLPFLSVTPRSDRCRFPDCIPLSKAWGESRLSRPNFDSSFSPSARNSELIGKPHWAHLYSSTKIPLLDTLKNHGKSSVSWNGDSVSSVYSVVNHGVLEFFRLSPFG